MSTPTSEDIKRVMSELGRRGGQSTSPAKRAAGKKNIAKALKVRIAKQRKGVTHAK